ncbi:hypothetical protein [Dehalococcoides mccartyi]|nr:hypothetical protein [Dehalococcoides mccartyi]
MNEVQYYQLQFWQAVIEVIAGIAFVIIIATEAIKAIREAVQ